jgi:transposase
MGAQCEQIRKERAVADYFNGLAAAQIATELAVSRSTIYAWIRNQKAEGLIKTVPTQKEVIKLKQKQTKLQDIISVLKAVDCTVKAPWHGAHTRHQHNLRSVWLGIFRAATGQGEFVSGIIGVLLRDY